MAAAAASLGKQLEQWLSAIISDPYTCGPQLWQDVLALPECFQNPHEGCYVSLGAVCLFASMAVVLLLCMCRLCRRIIRRVVAPPPPPVSGTLRQFQFKELEEIERRKKEKMKQEKNQRNIAGSVADDLLDIYYEGSILYDKDRSLPDMGSRLDKYWYRVTSQESYHCHLLTIGLISSNFTCDLEVESYLNKRLSQLQHPNVQTIDEVKFLTRKGKKHVAIIQPCWERGSLKDLIYKTSPFQEWSQKYNKITDCVPAEKVAKLGGQILEAVVYLYGRGLSPLGHIQSGNIYLEGEDTCRLGGYENTLLKSRARLYRTCENLKCLDDIDVIMFGHVIYEMSAGRELSRLVPNEQDFSCVADPGCREALRYIFARREGGRFKSGIISIQSHWFFGGTESEVPETIEPVQQPLKTKKAALLLQKTKQLLKQH